MDDATRRLVGVGAMLAPAVHTLTDAIEWAQGGFSPAQLWLNYAAFAPLPVLALGLYAAQRPRISRLGLAGALLYGYAFVYFAHTALLCLATGIRTYGALWDRLGAAYTIHGAVMVAGGLVFGFATERARVLPRWAAWAFLLGVGLNLVVALLPVPELLQTAGSALRNAGLAGMGWSLVRGTGGTGAEDLAGGRRYRAP